jgi:hypothetical protein
MVGVIYEQCLTYARLIELHFFNHASATSMDAPVVDVQAISSLALSVINQSIVIPIDASIINLMLDDSKTQTIVPVMAQMEDKLREEIRRLNQYRTTSTTTAGGS